MQLAKLENGILVSTFADDEDDVLIDQMKEDGFLPYVEESEQPVISGFQTVRETYREEDRVIYNSFEIVEISPDKVQEEIDRLEAELATSDYKIIKATEYSQLGITVPYDMAALHNERQVIRDKIGQFEELL